MFLRFGCEARGGVVVIINYTNKFILKLQAPDVNDNVAWQYAVNQAVYGICNLPVPTREPPCK